VLIAHHPLLCSLRLAGAEGEDALSLSFSDFVPSLLAGVVGSGALLLCLRCHLAALKRHEIMRVRIELKFAKSRHLAHYQAIFDLNFVCWRRFICLLLRGT